MKAETPISNIEPAPSEEHRRIEALLCEALDMLAGSKPFDAAFLSSSQETAMRPKHEVAAEFGKQVYAVHELEKKGMGLRQKHDLAQSLLQTVDVARLTVRFSRTRRDRLHTALAAAATASISVISGVLSLQTVRLDSVLSSPGLRFAEVLRSVANPESMVPFLIFQMIGGLTAILSLVALRHCRKLTRHLHHLKRALTAKHFDHRP